jgi:uncharacterized protein YjbI with pentapeptide repeats
MADRTTNMTQSVINRLAAISLSLSLTALTTGCAVADNAPVAQAPKTVPQMPFTEQSLKAFANAEDYQRLKQLSPLIVTSMDNEPLRFITIAYESRPYIWQDRLVSYPVPGSLFADTVTDPEQRQDYVSWVYSERFSWNPQGFLVALDQDGVSKQDWKLITQFPQLRSLRVSGFDEGSNIDLKWVRPLRKLEFLRLHGRKLYHFNEVCQFPKLAVLEPQSAYPQEPINFAGCQAPLTRLSFYQSRLDDLTINELPNLVQVDISRADIRKLTIDGDSLPKLQYLKMFEAKLPEDLSQVKLPESLIQIDMYGSNDPDIKKLILPENLKFLDLGGVKLDDFSFITTAKNLESLYLTGSNFHQYELLLKLPNLKHLILVDHQLTDQQLLILSKLKNLQYLNIAGNPVTSAQPLADLKDLHFIMLGGTNITDYEKIPYWPGVIGIELPNFEEHRRNTKIDDLPEHLQKMVLAGRMEDTEFLNSIPEPPPEIFG